MHLYFPNEILAIYSERALVHFARVLGATLPPALNSNNQRISLNRAVLAAARRLPTLAAFDPPAAFAYLLYAWQPPKDEAKAGAADDVVEDAETFAPRYMHLSPGEQGRLWDDWQRKGIASIGWSDVGDLTNVHSEAEYLPLRNAALNRNASWGSGGMRMVWTFRSLRVGDWIIARKGQSQLLGVGVITGPYQSDATAEYATRCRCSGCAPKRAKWTSILGCNRWESWTLTSFGPWWVRRK